MDVCMDVCYVYLIFFQMSLKGKNLYLPTKVKKKKKLTMTLSGAGRCHSLKRKKLIKQRDLNQP